MKTQWINGKLWVLLTQKPSSWAEVGAAVRGILDEAGTPDAKVLFCPAW